MRNVLVVLLIVSLFSSCSQSFHERQLRGTYKVDTQALFQNSSDGEGFGAFTEMLAGALEMKVTFEGEGKAKLHVGLGLIEGLISAFGGNAEVNGGAAVPLEWKVEGREIYLAKDGEDYELLGRVIDFRGYDEITLEVDRDHRETVTVTMVRMEDEE
ncbi:MAG: hypothetical protein AAFQ98_20300 [Bacteroidota bacterium]